MQKPSLSDVIGWDTGTWGKAIPLWEKVIKGRKGLQCLELGANQGGLSLWLAMHEEVKSVLCSDLKNTEEKVASLHKRYPDLKKKISYEDIDILNMEMTGTFDLVVFKSVIGACGRQACKNGKNLAMNHIYRLLAEGGILLFAENMQGHKIHRWFRKKFVPWSADWSYCSIEEWKHWLSAYHLHEIYFEGFWSVFGRKEWQKRILSWADRVTKNIISDKNKYMCFGFAVK